GEAPEAHEGQVLGPGQLPGLEDRREEVREEGHPPGELIALAGASSRGDATVRGREARDTYPGLPPTPVNTPEPRLTFPWRTTPSCCAEPCRLRQPRSSSPAVPAAPPRLPTRAPRKAGHASPR